MNIESLFEYITSFETEIIESGFKRDIQDYLNSLPNNQSNIVTLRDIATKIHDVLKQIYTGDLPEHLLSLFPKKNIRPFTEANHNDDFDNLLSDKEIELANFFAQLNGFITQLNNQIQANINEIQQLRELFKPYISVDKERIAEENKAMLSVQFKDKNTITNFNEFSGTISFWNRTLPLYQQLISSTSPEEIEIVEVQNGSIDFIINLNLDMALNLVDLFEIGFKGYFAYLTYKKIIEPIKETYGGNKALISSEKKREKDLLDNIGLQISEVLREQHKKALAADKKIDKNIDIKIEQVTSLITSHIIKGNDLKLLVAPEKEDAKEEDKVEPKKIRLKELSSKVRNTLKQLPPIEIKLLIEKYGSHDGVE